MTLMGLGAIPATIPEPGPHRQCTGTWKQTGQHSLRPSHRLGTRFSDRVAGHTSHLAKNAKIVQLTSTGRKSTRTWVTIIPHRRRAPVLRPTMKPSSALPGRLTQVESWRENLFPPVRREAGARDSSVRTRQDDWRGHHVHRCGQHRCGPPSITAIKDPASTSPAAAPPPPASAPCARLAPPWNKAGKPDATIVHITETQLRMNAGELARELLRHPVTQSSRKRNFGMVPSAVPNVRLRTPRPPWTRGPDSSNLPGPRDGRLPCLNGKEFADAFVKAVSSGKTFLNECRILTTRCASHGLRGQSHHRLPAGVFSLNKITKTYLLSESIV
jgi:hypothetical protein